MKFVQGFLRAEIDPTRSLRPVSTPMAGMIATETGGYKISMIGCPETSGLARLVMRPRSCRRCETGGEAHEIGLTRDAGFGEDVLQVRLRTGRGDAERDRRFHQGTPAKEARQHPRFCWGQVEGGGGGGGRGLVARRSVPSRATRFLPSTTACTGSMGRLV